MLIVPYNRRRKAEALLARREAQSHLGDGADGG